MKVGFVISLVVFVGLILAFTVGVFSQQPMLALPYMCLSPFAGIALGRASVGVIKRARVAVLSDRDMQILQQARNR